MVMAPRPAIVAAPVQRGDRRLAASDERYLLRVVEDVADWIRGQAVIQRDGSVAWPDGGAVGGAHRTVDGVHLYGGSLGTLLFLAALDFVRETSDHREFVLRGVIPLRRALAAVANGTVTKRSRVPIGGLIGVGSIIYGLVRIAQWVGVPELVTDARRGMLLLSRRRIEADDRLDIESGCAGAILALLALHRVAPEPDARGETALKLAGACANHLLAVRRQWREGLRAWSIGGRQPRAGFAHGAAGIAYALLRLLAYEANEEWRDAALEGIVFERARYGRCARGWPYPPARPWLDRSWCYGAPGLLLSRILALGTTEDPETREELGELLHLVRDSSESPVDQLCCGNLGRVDVLISVAGALRDPESWNAGRGLAFRVLDRCRAPHDFRLNTHDDIAVPRLSLFRGVAGIGFGLLRLAYPDALPSVLCLE